MNEEYILKINFMQQEAEKAEEQINLVNQQIRDFEVLKLSLDKIEEEKEVLANLGKGIFVNSEIKSRELFVNIGQGVIVKKSPEETAGIIDKQILQLNEIKRNLLNEIEKINSQLQDLIEEARRVS